VCNSKTRNTVVLNAAAGQWLAGTGRTGTFCATVSQLKKRM
jgi:hypothetical protein